MSMFYGDLMNAAEEAETFKAIEKGPGPHFFWK